MKKSALALAALFLLAANAQNLKTAKTPDTGSSLDRGKYIVEDVAVCRQCHTPKLENGKRDEANSLMGSPIQWEPLISQPDWALRAPRIAGRPPGTDDQFLTLLTTGIARTGKPPKPPMPQFHMTKADAEAVLAYLKSLQR